MRRRNMLAPRGRRYASSATLVWHYIGCLSLRPSFANDLRKYAGAREHARRRGHAVQAARAAGSNGVTLGCAAGDGRHGGGGHGRAPAGLGECVCVCVCVCVAVLRRKSEEDLCCAVHPGHMADES